MKSVSIILSVFLLFSLVGCSASEKVAEKVQEKAIEKAIGGDAEVDIQGDQYTIKDKDGNKFSVGGTQWPEGVAADMLPKFDKGTMSVGLVSDQVCSISFENVEQKDFESYRDAVKAAGFVQNALEQTYEQSYTYQGYLDEKKSIALNYEAADKSLLIMAMIDE